MKLNSFPAALVLVVAILAGATLVALGRPDVAAYSSLLGVIIQSLLPSVVSSLGVTPSSTSIYRVAPPAPPAAPPAVVEPPGASAVAFAFLGALGMGLVPAVGCTAAARSTAAAVVSDVASATPLICSLVSTQSPSAGSACSTDAGAASSVAQLIASILASLPPSTASQSLGLAGIDVTYHGVAVHVAVPAAQRDAVIAKLGTSS